MKRIYLLVVLILTAVIFCMPAYARTADITALGAQVNGTSPQQYYTGSWNVVITDDPSLANTFDVNVTASPFVTGQNTTLESGSTFVGQPQEDAHHVTINFLGLGTLSSSVIASQSNTLGWLSSDSGNNGLEWTAPVSGGTFTSDINYDGTNSFSGTITLKDGYWSQVNAVSSAIADGQSGAQWNAQSPLVPESPALILLLLGCLPFGLVVLGRKKSGRFISTTA